MNVSILGCGWLGLPLAGHLISRGHTLKGSTTTKDKMLKLKNRSIKPFLFKLDPELSAESKVDDFFQSGVLVLNIPPGRGRENVIAFHTAQIEAVINEITDSSIKHVIFISSTSVYPQLPGKVSEQDTILGKAGRDSGNALLQAEDLLMKANQFNTTVLRFGGLIGGDRHPAKYLAGRKNLSKANAPVNLIHREDCIAIITQIIEERITGEIFNAIADDHPTRKTYYAKAAQKMGLEPPEFKPSIQKKVGYKIVSNTKLKEILNYSFIHLLV